jgi:non-ribosomal peptide synthetase component F
MQPVLFGIPEELYIAGPTVSQAYINRPDSTTRAFMKDPFAPAIEVEIRCSHLYRTGDLYCLNW